MSILTLELIGLHWIIILFILKVLELNTFQAKSKKLLITKTSNIFRIQGYNIVMCGYFCIGFIDFMLEGKRLTVFTNLFSPNSFKKNDDIILNYFQKS